MENSSIEKWELFDQNIEKNEKASEEGKHSVDKQSQSEPLKGEESSSLQNSK